MRIWQLQVGCLFWCYGAVELQSAVASETTLTVPGTVSVAQGPGAAPSSAGPAVPPAGPTPAGATPAGGDAAAADPGASSRAGTDLVPAFGQGAAISSPPPASRIASPPPAGIASPAPGPITGVDLVLVGEPASRASVTSRPPMSGGTVVAGVGRGAPGSPVVGAEVAPASRATPVFVDPPITRAAGGGSAGSSLRVTVIAIRPAARAAADLSASPLVVALGGAAALVLLAFFVTVSRRMTSGL
jgi:hypothetical protein